MRCSLLSRPMMFASSRICSFVFTLTVCLVINVAIPAAVKADQIFFQNVQINSVPLETAAGFTNPLITSVGFIGSLAPEPFLHIHVELHNGNGTSDILSVQFIQTGGTLPDTPLGGLPPLNETVFGFGTEAHPQTFDAFYAHRIGTYEGFVVVNILSSSPDYRIPGSGLLVDTRTFPFRYEGLVVPTPEPATLVLFGTGLFGIVSIAFRKRR